MEELKIFKNSDFGEVRTLEVNGEPYFVGKDVATILGYAKPENAISTHVDKEDKTTTLIQGTGSNYKSNVVIINESGLYSLILSSKLPQAKQFKRWVTSEVLPSIRKHGLYAKDELLDNPDLLISIITELKIEREKNKQQEQVINELQPKATYYDLVLQNKDLVPISIIAKDYGMSGKGMNQKLHELKVQYTLGSTWLLYSKYQDKGYTSSKTITYDKNNGTKGSKMYTNWTQKGRLFIYDLLKSENILPLIERE